MSPPTRRFKLEIEDGLLPITNQKMKGYNGIQLNNNMWFNTKARVPGSQMVQVEYMRNIETQIKQYITAEAKRLQNFWYSNVNKYFNRRAYGMHYYRGGKFGLLTATRRFRGNLSNRSQYRRREHTGQLKRALRVQNMTLHGCDLYVQPCYARTGRAVDYVNILMVGARPSHTPYIPKLDKRIDIPGKFWGGISRAYWATWQAVFEKQVNAANQRLNNRIRQYLIESHKSERSDMGRATRKSSATKTIVTTRQDTLSRPTLKTNFGTAPFNKFRTKDIFKNFKP